MRSAVWGAAAAVALMLVSGPSATAATQVGQTFVPTGDCGTDFTHLQTDTDPPGQYTIPSAGVVTSWSFQAAASAPQIELKIARPLGAAQFTIVGESDRKSPALNMLNTYPERISVQPGDVIGLYVSTSDLCADTLAGSFVRSASGDRPAGSTDNYTLAPVPARLDVSALVEPDCDSDGSGDETQDPELTGPNCPTTQPPKGNRSLTLDANKNKVKRGKKVLLSGRLTTAGGQGPCDAGQTVELQRKRPKQPAFATFAQVQSDAQGGFSLKLKLKKTFEFRAQLLETAACTAALSDSERVKVKKRRR